MDLEIVSQKEKDKCHIKYLYVESRKMVQRNLFAKQKYRHNVENKPMDTKGGKGRWDELGDWD